MNCREEMIRNNLKMQLNHQLNLNLEHQGSGAYVAALDREAPNFRCEEESHAGQ